MGKHSLSSQVFHVVCQIKDYVYCGVLSLCIRTIRMSRATVSVTEVDRGIFGPLCCACAAEETRLPGLMELVFQAPLFCLWHCQWKLKIVAAVEIISLAYILRVDLSVWIIFNVLRTVIPPAQQSE